MHALITKEIAERVAIKLLEKKKQVWTEATEKKVAFITDVATRRVPKDIALAFEKYPMYIETYGYFNVRGQGISGAPCVNLKKSIPSSTNYLELNAKESEKFLKLKYEEVDAKSKYENLLSEVKTALINCKTYNRVKELFPEAYEHLPAKYPPPALNLTEVRKKIK